MLFWKLYKITVTKVTSVGFKGGDRSTLDPTLCGVRMNGAEWNKIIIKMVWKQFVVIGVDGFTY